MLRSEKVFVVPEWRARLREQGLERIEALFTQTAGEVVASSGTSEVRRIILEKGGRPHILFLKKYWFRTAREIWKSALRGAFFGRPKVQKEFASLQRLQRLGINAATPLAWGVFRQARCLQRSFLITEGVPHPTPLDAYIRDGLAVLSAPENQRVRRRLIERLADFTRQMHGQHFVHHDYFWRNIILSGTDPETFFLIDAPKGRRWFPGMALRSRAKDLGTLDAPAPRFFRRTERLRFYLRYVNRARLTPADKKLIRQAMAVAATERERQLRRVGIPPALASRSAR